MNRISLQITADYHQLYIHDSLSTDISVHSWNVKEVESLLSIKPGSVGIGTFRSGRVRFEFEVVKAFPSASQQYDKVNSCNIDLPSGILVIRGPTEYLPNAHRIELEPGLYSLRIYYGGMDSISKNELDGNDFYFVIAVRLFG